MGFRNRIAQLDLGRDSSEQGQAGLCLPPSPGRQGQGTGQRARLEVLVGASPLQSGAWARKGLGGWEGVASPPPLALSSTRVHCGQEVGTGWPPWRMSSPGWGNATPPALACGPSDWPGSAPCWWGWAHLGEEGLWPLTWGPSSVPWAPGDT